MATGVFRHELKYLINAVQRELLHKRLRGLISPDAHAGEDEAYHIRSLYFDNYNNEALNDKLIGAPDRSKFRIRVYGFSDRRITLERKDKVKNVTQKHSAPLTAAQCAELVAGRPLEVSGDLPPLVNQLGLLMRMEGMRPVQLVDYVRTPLIYEAGNVRITFDSRLSAPIPGDFNLFDAELPSVPILSRGTAILEVKFDGFLPDFIMNCLQMEGVTPQALSKYDMCRRPFLVI